jgi:TorA maturation chaperone TorD
MGFISGPLIPFEVTGLLLRDFFIANNNSTLVTAYLALEPDAQKNTLAMEYDFNALFLGPQALKAAPYASVYLEEEATVMGKTTLELREFMRQLGLSINHDNHLPDDHVSYALELCVLLLTNVRQQPELKEMLFRYVFDYIAKWMPLFILNITGNAQTMELKKVASRLADWLMN